MLVFEHSWYLVISRKTIDKTICIFLDYLFKEMFDIVDWVVVDGHFVDPEVVYEDSDFAIFSGHDYQWDPCGLFDEVAADNNFSISLVTCWA